MSLEDSVQVIMQSLTEATETCYITNFQLEVEGKRVDEYTSLSEIPNLQNNTTFVMVEAPYDEKTARIHVKLLREILTSGHKMDQPNACLLPYYTFDELNGKKPSSNSDLPLM